jgi:hypothetical protein
VIGEKGKVEAFLPRGVFRFGLRDGNWSAPVHEEIVTDDRVLVEGFHHGASYLEHLDLIAAIREGRPATVNADDGYWSVVMGAAAQRAIEERRVVDLAEFARLSEELVRGPTAKEPSRRSVGTPHDGGSPRG